MKHADSEMKIESRPKVVAMYESVLGLLDDGADITAIKVADITARAKIGKGTAYEYFESREDIIAGAIVYDMERWAVSIKKQFEMLPDFISKVKASFDWIMIGFRERNAFTRFLYYTSQSDTLGRAILKNVRNKNAEEFSPVAILMQLCEQGKAEGKIRDALGTGEAAMMLIGSMVTLIMCIGHLQFETKGPHPDGACLMDAVDPDKMESVLCEGYLKSIG